MTYSFSSFESDTYRVISATAIDSDLLYNFTNIQIRMHFHGSSPDKHSDEKTSCSLLNRETTQKKMGINGALVLLFLISVSQVVSFSTARSFLREFPPVIDGVIFSGEVSVVSNSKTATVVGCETEGDHFTGEYSTSPGVYGIGKYGSLVLNVLPKGSVPASGPSKRINDVKT